MNIGGIYVRINRHAPPKSNILGSHGCCIWIDNRYRCWLLWKWSRGRMAMMMMMAVVTTMVIMMVMMMVMMWMSLFYFDFCIIFCRVFYRLFNWFFTWRNIQDLYMFPKSYRFGIFQQVWLCQWTAQRTWFTLYRDTTPFGGNPFTILRWINHNGSQVGFRILLFHLECAIYFGIILRNWVWVQLWNVSLPMWGESSIYGFVVVL